MRIFVIVLACLCLTFGTGASAQTKSSNTLAAVGSSGAITALKQKGATFGTMTPKMSRAVKGLKSSSGGANTAGYQCTHSACWCAGLADCMDMADTWATDCDTFRCNNDGGQTVCYCEYSTN